MKKVKLEGYAKVSAVNAVKVVYKGTGTLSSNLDVKGTFSVKSGF